MDIEFIAQYLMLRHGAANPEIFSTTTPIALKNLREAGFLAPGAAETLEAASGLYQGLTQLLRLAVDGAFRPADAPRGLTEMLLRFGDSPNLSHLEALLAETQRQVRDIFTAVIGPVSRAKTASGEL